MSRGPAFGLADVHKHVRGLNSSIIPSFIHTWTMVPIAECRHAKTQSEPPRVRVSTGVSAQGAASSRQEKLKSQFDQELSSACWESLKLVERLAPSVIGLAALNTVYSSISEPLNILRRQKGQEPKHYEPLVALLNSTLDALLKYHSPSNYHYKLCFYVYKRKMVEGVDGPAPLKAHVLGLHTGDAEPDQTHLESRVLWFNAKIPVGVKEDSVDLLAHCATYVKAQFASDKSLYFVPVIAYRQTSKMLRLCIFDRVGAICAPEFDMREPPHQHLYIQAISALLSWKTPKEAGYDTSRSNYTFSLPKPYGQYRITEAICERNCLRGRATRVYVLTPEDAGATTPTQSSALRLLLLPLRPRSPKSEQALPPAAQRLIHTTHPHDNPPALSHGNFLNQQRRLGGGHAGDIDGDVNGMGSTGGDQPTVGDDKCTLFEPDSNWRPPKTMVLKDSYCMAGQPDEAAVFASARSNFGLPKVLAGYPVELKLGEHLASNSTSRIRPPDATPIQLNNRSASETGQQEHRRLLIETVGSDLTWCRDARNIACLEMRGAGEK
ncbi:hypothetical protein BOTBODRAFT_173201 [Botryobasidium botryosum FD-172 SS1]|uniref:Fungal-type protein kinase domain-containing protein n=1 Tax=Botryobasidium botryosum (strain FD-172 SS1) TaxID=930990 RepID=A0A067MNL0_BOTB1|nr:hypothetical protein BOTBODRAFT_173201 [Botryobasidium botryosum FD-172 SS1]